MKRTFFIGFAYICVSMLVYADEICDQSIVEAKQKYNAGNYAKARALFEFVKDECGANYGDVASWISKCDGIINPRLSLSRTYISVGPESGTEYITITSNRECILKNTSSSLFTVTKSGNTVTIKYNANPNTSSRSASFDVATTDGSKSQKVTVNQSAKSVVPSLSLNKTSISCSSSGTTEYITVNCNVAWEIEYPSATMYSVTRSGNSLTVKINENTSTESRNDFFNVKTTDGGKVVKVTINQSAKSVSNSTNSISASIDKVWVDHNVYQNSVKGMKIHVKFNVYNMLGRKGQAAAYFYFDNSQNTPLKDYNQNYRSTDGNVSHGTYFTPGYANCVYNDLEIFMPYSELHCTNTGKYELKFYVVIWSDRNLELKRSDWVKFTLTN